MNVGFVRHGHRLVIYDGGQDGKFQVWDVARKTKVCSFDDEFGQAVLANSSGSYYHSHDQLWDSSGKWIDLKDKGGNSIQISPDETKVLVSQPAGDIDIETRLVSLPSGKDICRLEIPKINYKQTRFRLLFTPDQKVCAFGIRGFHHATSHLG